MQVRWDCMTSEKSVSDFQYQQAFFEERREKKKTNNDNDDHDTEIIEG